MKKVNTLAVKNFIYNQTLYIHFLFNFILLKELELIKLQKKVDTKGVCFISLL